VEEQAYDELSSSKGRYSLVGGRSLLYRTPLGYALGDVRLRWLKAVAVHDRIPNVEEESCLGLEYLV
jgi:hypothetical protein